MSSCEVTPASSRPTSRCRSSSNAACMNLEAPAVVVDLRPTTPGAGGVDEAVPHLAGGARSVPLSRELARSNPSARTARRSIRSSSRTCTRTSTRATTSKPSRSTTSTGSTASPISSHRHVRGSPYRRDLRRRRARLAIRRSSTTASLETARGRGWKRIPLDIKAHQVVPAIYRGRLCLFWPEMKVLERAASEPACRAAIEQLHRARKSPST